MKTAALLPLLLLVCACGPDVPNLDSPGKTIVCLGDSITSGVGAEPGQPFPALLAAKLSREVVNEGVPGDTAEDGLARVDQALAHDPWMVIVELGGNDILRQVPPARTEAALRQVLDRLLAARVVPVLVELEVPFAGRYSEVFDRIEDDYDIPVVEDTLGEILLDPALKADPIHPNAQGHVQLAEAIADVVEPILEKRGRR
ncbi:MAG TPA: GDSL-type esterase/lipase family protein [Thermoanaerobaculia bacterium]|nr:GDSL-type esterase/lipase family protein [Thermoanaerobaculia bacterium]